MAPKPQNIDLETYRDITDDVLESDFVPYACHYSPHTLLTKNGELLQTLKIPSFASDAATDLRAAIRAAMLDSIPDNRYAVWLHTIRRPQDLRPPATFATPLAEELNTAWNAHYGWESRFVNDIYITLVREGLGDSPWDVKNFLLGLTPKKFRAKQTAYLEQGDRELTAITEKMLATLGPLGAERLGVVEEDGVFFSEPCRFLGKIINLEDMKMPLPDLDLAHYLTTQEITFGFNAMEVRSHAGKRRFGSILTLKEYQELSPELLDRVLQLPVEFIITQCISFVGSGKALAEYEYQKKLLTISGDTDLARSSGLEEILASNHGSPIDYGEQQSSIFLLAGDLKSLERYVARAVSTLYQLGIMSVREDIRFEECYWAQLPANFIFLKRMKAINTARFGGFANLCAEPMGQASANHWGDAVTVLSTAVHTPYYFNFHVGNVGHTLMVGPDAQTQSAQLHFLLAQARKFGGRLVYFDAQGDAQNFITALGGKSVHFTPGARSEFPINPLQLADSDMNRRFLKIWVASLLGLHEENWTDADQTLITQSIQHIFSLPADARNITALSEFFATNSPAMATALAPWMANGEYAGLLSANADTSAAWPEMISFGLEDLRGTPALLPVFSYLLHRLTQSLAQQPCIVVFRGAWALLDNPTYAARMGSWLNKLAQHNGLAIFTSADAGECADSVLTQSLAGCVPTRLFQADPFLPRDAANALGLGYDAFSLITVMDADAGHTLLQRGEESVVLEFPLAALGSALSALVGMAETTPDMQRALPATTAPAMDIFDDNPNAGDAA